MKIRIQRVTDGAFLPEYAHGPHEDAGMDLRAIEETVLRPRVATLVPTGLAIELPAGYEAQIRPRSGLAYKHGVTVTNSPGTIDPAYRGEIKVIMINLSDAEYVVRKGDRVAQMVIARYEAVEWEEGRLSESVRGSGGFGSSGR